MLNKKQASFVVKAIALIIALTFALSFVIWMIPIFR
jgi:hypothetical protein